MSAIHPGKSATQALVETLDLAPIVEDLGYSCFWLAEHHTADAAHGSPELLCSIIAGLTHKIRVGTAGVLLSLYSPRKVVENFRLLEALFPTRIDLGLARGRMDTPFTAGSMANEREAASPDEYAEKVSAVVAQLRNDGPGAAMPAGAGMPNVWVLGSAVGSAPLASRHGVSYSHSLFLPGSRDDPSILVKYRARFQPSRERAEPRCNLAVAGICADSDARAKRLARRYSNAFLRPTILGAPERCLAALTNLRRRYRVHEIVFLDLCPNFKDQVRSYELLARVCDLKG